MCVCVPEVLGIALLTLKDDMDFSLSLARLREQSREEITAVWEPSALLQSTEIRGAASALLLVFFIFFMSRQQRGGRFYRPNL